MSRNAKFAQIICDSSVELGLTKLGHFFDRIKHKMACRGGGEIEREVPKAK